MKFDNALNWDVEISVYMNSGNTSVQLNMPSGEPYCRLSVNPPVGLLPADVILVPSWKIPTDLIESLAVSGFITPLGVSVTVGYAKADVFKVNIDEDLLASLRKQVIDEHDAMNSIADIPF